MRLIFRRRVIVAGTASLAAGIEDLLELTVGHGVAIDVTVETFETVVNRVRDVVGKCRSVAAGLVTVGANRAIDRFVVLLLSHRNPGAQPTAEGNDRD